MSIAAEACQEALTAMPGKDSEQRARACEQAGIRISLHNLMTFPFVHQAVNTGRLAIHGWYFDLESGELLVYEPGRGTFQTVSSDSIAQPITE